MCSTAVKVKLFTAYFSNVYMCALWVNYRKTAFHQFKVAYNNSYRILNRLPMRRSASSMFANDNVNSSTCVKRTGVDRWGTGGRVPPHFSAWWGPHRKCPPPPTFLLKKWKISCVLSPSNLHSLSACVIDTGVYK